MSWLTSLFWRGCRWTYRKNNFSLGEICHLLGENTTAITKGLAKLILTWTTRMKRASVSRYLRSVDLVLFYCIQLTSQIEWTNFSPCVCVTLSLSEHDVTRVLHKMKRELPNSYQCIITKNENESRYADQLTANKIVTWRSINEAEPSQNTPYLHEIDKKRYVFSACSIRWNSV